MLTEQHLAQVFIHASRTRIRDFLAPLNEAMREHGIDGGLRRTAAFLAQLGHESGEFQFMEELWGPTEAQKRYEPQSRLATDLGNTEPGDGKRFKGRGPIQVTGRANYARYGALLDVDLLARPELAATPAVGFRVAGLYWSKNGLNALADANDFERITRRINGGLNGQAQRARLYERALAVLAPAFPAGAAAPLQQGPAEAAQAPFERGAEALRAGADTRGDDTPLADTPAPKPSRNKRGTPRTAQGRKLDARRDTLDFRDLMYTPTLIEVPTHVSLGEYLEVGVPILDQGQEGACTGFGLATVANYLLLRRRVLPDPVPVSARMLYHLARRYDEWPGEDYEGSSARGAMKGWHKHGVCKEELFPNERDDGVGLTDERTSEARRRPLGAYFRVNHQDIVAMHSALAEVGILYATCTVHEGWQDVGSDGVIAPSDRAIGGHAFAIVAYDDEGFWLQNSWGPDWGRGGFARVGYDDWLRNGTDVWVARLGAPVTLRTSEATAAAHAAGAGQSAAYAYADLRPHIVSVGNDGALRAGGDYGITPGGLATVFERDIPRVSAGWKTQRVLLYAHGGLTSEAAAVQRLAEYRPALLEGQVYPLAFVWRTDVWTTLANILQDAVRRRRSEGLLDAAKDFMLDRLDDALEPLARVLAGKAMWDEMKENALAAGAAAGASRAVADHLKALHAKRPVEIHLVGHSAGSIFLAPLVGLLAERGLAIASCSLWAPACTTEFFKRHYAPAIEQRRIERFAMYLLDDKTEQDDDCARVYNKSLLYLVSHAFEAQARIPGFREGVPLLGLARCVQEDAAVMKLFDDPRHQLVLAPNLEPVASGAASQARHHGDFDDDEATVASTFLRIVGGTTTPAKAAPARRQADGEAARKAAPAGREKMAAMKFRRSSEALRERRQGIDAQTTPTRR